MRSHEQTVRTACIAVAVSIAASTAGAATYMLLRRHDTAASVKVDRVASPPRSSGPLLHSASQERELLGQAAWEERRRQGIVFLESQEPMRWRSHEPPR